MRHKKQYARSGTGVGLRCNGVLVVKSPYRGANFSLEPCRFCGMSVRTTGFSPETDEVFEAEYVSVNPLAEALG
jgi:hypothetical protein